MAKVRGLITSSIGFAASSGVGSYFARGVRVRRCVENESLAANTVDHRRFFGSIDLTEKSPYVGINEIGFRHKLIFPNFPEEHCSSHQLTLTSHQVCKQAKFARQQIDRTAITADGERYKIKM